MYKLLDSCALGIKHSIFIIVLLTGLECNWTSSVGSEDLRFADHQVN